MHALSEQTRSTVDDILDYARRRALYEDVPLDKPLTPRDLSRLASGSITADGIGAISPTVVEAAVASGSTPWQVITKVQLPMARQSLALAANQGLIYVLAMVVVGALVGAGGLGYDVVAGFVQSAIFGKGLAAGLAIVFLGILLDRMTQAAAAAPLRKIPSSKIRLAKTSAT